MNMKITTETKEYNKKNKTQFNKRKKIINFIYQRYKYKTKNK